MKTLARNKNNDIFIAARQLALVEGKAAECCIVDSVVNTQKGELQFEPTKGIDYFGTVFEHPRYIEVWAGQVRLALRKLSWVDSVEDFTYSFDAPSGTVHWSVNILTTDGTSVSTTANSYIGGEAERTMGVDWDEIVNKPAGLDEALKSLNAMREAARKKTLLVKRDTLGTVKEVVNDVVLTPMKSTHAIASALLVSAATLLFGCTAYAIPPLQAELDDIPGDTKLCTNVVPWVVDYVTGVAGVTPSTVTNIASSSSVTNMGAVNALSGKFLRLDTGGTVNGEVRARQLSVYPIETALGDARFGITKYGGVGSINFYFGGFNSWLVPDGSQVVTTNMLAHMDIGNVKTNDVLNISTTLLTKTNVWDYANYTDESIVGNLTNTNVAMRVENGRFTIVDHGTNVWSICWSEDFAASWPSHWNASWPVSWNASWPAAWSASWKTNYPYSTDRRFGSSETNAVGQSIVKDVLLRGQGSDTNKVYRLKVVNGELGIEEV